jgi:hypothetical protein
LPADFQREREFSGVSDGYECLAQGQNVGFGAIAAPGDCVGNVGGIDVSKTLIVNGEAALAFDVCAPPGVGIPGVIAKALEEILVISVSAVSAKVRGAGGAGDGEAAFDFVAGARVAAEVPVGHGRALLSEEFVEEAGEWGGRRWGGVLGGKRSGCQEKNKEAAKTNDERRMTNDGPRAWINCSFGWR